MSIDVIEVRSIISFLLSLLLLGGHLVKSAAPSLNSVQCVSMISNISNTAGANAGRAKAVCNSTYPTLLSCGYRTEDSNSFYARGTAFRYVPSADPKVPGHPQRCTADHGSSPATPTYSYAQCCNFATLDWLCDHHRSSGNFGPGAVNTDSCSTSGIPDSQFLFGCAALNEQDDCRGTSGSFPFDDATDFHGLSSYPIEKPVELSCSGQVNPTPQPTNPPPGADDNSIQVEGEMQCCKRNDGSAETVECINIIQRSTSGSTTEIDCTGWSKYESSSTFISGCSGWTPSIGRTLKYVYVLYLCYYHCVQG